MTRVNATKLMVAFYRGQLNPASTFVRAQFWGASSEDRYEDKRLFGELSLVFPGLQPLFQPAYTTHSNNVLRLTSFRKARLQKFDTWNELQAEDPHTTLVVMNKLHDVELELKYPSQGQDRRFAAIMWQRSLELTPGKLASFGDEPSVHFELTDCELFEPGWTKKHRGFVRYDAATQKPIQVEHVPVELTQNRTREAPT